MDDVASFFLSILFVAFILYESGILGPLFSLVVAEVSYTALHNITGPYIGKLCKRRFPQIYYAACRSTSERRSEVDELDAVVHTWLWYCPILLHKPATLLFGWRFRWTVMVTVCGFAALELAVLGGLVMYKLLPAKGRSYYHRKQSQEELRRPLRWWYDHTQ